MCFKPRVSVVQWSLEKQAVLNMKNGKQKL